MCANKIMSNQGPLFEVFYIYLPKIICKNWPKLPIAAVTSAASKPIILFAPLLVECLKIFNSQCQEEYSCHLVDNLLNENKKEKMKMQTMMMIN